MPGLRIREFTLRWLPRSLHFGQRTALASGRDDSEGLRGVEAPDDYEDNEEEEEAQGGLVFVVASELGEGEGAGGRGVRVEGRDGGLFGGREAREEERNGLGVGVEGCAMVAAKFEFFAAHDKGVDEREISEEENGGGPGVHGHGGSEGEDAAAEVERIARVGVGTGGGEERLLVEVAGGVGADEETDDADAGSEENGARDGAGEIEDEDGEDVTDADAPAGEEVEGGHGVAPRRRRRASKTWLTEILRRDGEVWASRSWVVGASGSRITMGCGG